MRWYITAPATGNYTFWIAGDDNSELWLSLNDNAANKVRIGWVSLWTDSASCPSKNSSCAIIVRTSRSRAGSWRPPARLIAPYLRAVDYDNIGSQLHRLPLFHCGPTAMSRCPAEPRPVGLRISRVRGVFRHARSLLPEGCVRCESVLAPGGDQLLRPARAPAANDHSERGGSGGVGSAPAQCTRQMANRGRSVGD
jgi:hypothetical protein